MKRDYDHYNGDIRMLIYPNYFMRCSPIQRNDEGEYEVLSDDLLLSYNILSYIDRENLNHKWYGYHGHYWNSDTGFEKKMLYSLQGIYSTYYV